PWHQHGDGRKAHSKQWRVSEAALCCTALLGGWPAGYLAMKVLRHKTVKGSFRRKYAAATGCNIALLLALHPRSRATGLRHLEHLRKVRFK
ncbi:unnamed protein product, partial [Polarella glacialis]